jgi:hypothetical protein
LEKLAPYYGKTDRIPIYIVASSMCIDDIWSFEWAVC